MKYYKRYYPLFVLPTLIAFTIAFLIPFILGLYFSFTNWKGTSMSAKFIGISNYVKVFHDQKFINSFIFTFKFAVISVILINLVAFIFAYILTRHIKGRDVFRTIFFMPNLIGGIVLGYIWMVMIDAIILPMLGLQGSIHGNETYGFWGLVLVMNWQMAGYMMIIYIAAIQNIPKELIEAADVDGANLLQKITKIIIPSVMPAVTICLFLTLSNSFKLFDQNLALTGGMPNNRTQMLALNIYNTFFSQRLPALAQTKAVLFLILVGALVLTQVAITSRKEVEN